MKKAVKYFEGIDLHLGIVTLKFKTVNSSASSAKKPSKGM